MARDNFNREIDYLRISVTDRCNLGCIYCMPADRPRCFDPEEILTAGEIERIVRIARGFGVRKVRLTGGEPLLRPDIAEIVTRLKGTGLRELGLTTNGIRLNDMARPLREAGLDRVNVSLDTLSAERYREITRGGALEDALRGIEAARREGLAPVKINMVPIRGVNDGEVLDFARLTLGEPVHVRFIEFMPTRRTGLWDRALCVTTDEIMAAVEGIGPLERLPFRGRGPSRNYRLPGAPGVIGFISAVSHEFCYCCNRLRVSAVGGIRPCLFSRTEVDIKAPMRAGADDGELARVFALAVAVKPAGNYLKEPEKTSLDTMSSIGG